MTGNKISFFSPRAIRLSLCKTTARRTSLWRLSLQIYTFGVPNISRLRSNHFTTAGYFTNPCADLFHRASAPRLSLRLFWVQFVVMPIYRIFVDIFYVFPTIVVISNNMVVITCLPNIFTAFLITKSFKRWHKLRTRAIWAFYLCRDRRPRLSAISGTFITLHQ